MLELKCLQSVSERDIDMLLVEELESSEQFREWVASRAYAQRIYKARIGAWHSVSHPSLGESDLLFLFLNESDGRAAVLVENKIDAPPQPGQGVRYRERGRVGQENGLWDEFKTCVVAPEKYLKSARHSDHYDAEISYEEIMAFFLSRRRVDGRFAHKAMVVQEGIQQNRRKYHPPVDPGLTRFVEDYYAFAQERCPSAAMDAPRPRPSQSTWIVFQPACLPKHSYIAHQITAGFVKLFFPGAAQRLDELTRMYAPNLPSGAEVLQAGKSVAVSKAVPAMDDPWKKPFADYAIQAAEALDAVLELIGAVEKTKVNEQGAALDAQTRR